MSVSEQLSKIVPGRVISNIDGILSSIFENRKALLIICLGPAFLVYAFVALIPIIWSINLGLYEVSTLSPEWIWSGPARYLEIVSTPEFQSAFWRSLVFGFGSIFVQLIIGVYLALLVNKQFPGAVLARALALLSYMVPAVVVGMVGSFMLNPQFGIINVLLVEIGILNQPIAFLGQASTALATIIGAAAWKFAVFITLLTLARLQSIPESFYEAATVAGANSWEKFRDITLPRIKNVILIAVLLRALWMFNKFDIVWIMTKGGPGQTTTTIPVFAYEVAFIDFELGRAAAIATLLFVFLAFWSIIYFRVAQPEQEVRVQ